MVTILLAVYNGEKFLREQLDSLLSQSFSDIKILARDDGSTDGSAALLNEYAERFPEKVSVITGKSTGGAATNFFELMKSADGDYIMFCDQDDVWLKEKVEKTYKKMKALETECPDRPLLVHSDLKVVDGELNIKSESFFDFQQISPERDALNNLLVQNNVTGCTVMINKPLLKLALKTPDTCAMHDWWLALLAALFGKTDYISEPLMLYRQHGFNQVGAKKATGIEFIVNKFKNRKQTRKNYLSAFAQARELLRLHGESMTDEQKEIVSAFADLESGSKLKKIAIIRKYDFRKNTLIRTVGQYFSI